MNVIQIEGRNNHIIITNYAECEQGMILTNVDQTAEVRYFLPTFIVVHDETVWFQLSR